MWDYHIQRVIYREFARYDHSYVYKYEGHNPSTALGPSHYGTLQDNELTHSVYSCLPTDYFNLRFLNYAVGEYEVFSVCRNIFIFLMNWVASVPTLWQNLLLV